MPALAWTKYANSRTYITIKATNIRKTVVCVFSSFQELYHPIYFLDMILSLSDHEQGFLKEAYKYQKTVLQINPFQKEGYQQRSEHHYLMHTIQYSSYTYVKVIPVHLLY